MCGCYHQDERDAAAGCAVIGLVGLIAIMLILALAIALIGTNAPARDGSNAGAGAATVEEIRGIG